MRTKIFIFLFVLLILVGGVLAKDFIIYNASNPAQNYFTINGTTTNVNALGNVSASWFQGIFNWIIGSTSQNYLSFNGTQLSFNEGFMNGTIDQRIAANPNAYITWTNATNGTLMTQATFNTNYTTNDAVYRSFSNNYSNFSTTYGYALNSTPWTLNYTNFSNIYGNVTLYNGSEYKWNANYSNFSTVYGYAINDSASGISWATAYNGTLAKTDAANTFGAFNQTFDSGALFIDAVSNRVGINTSTPQQTLNVVGSANITGSLTSGILTDPSCDVKSFSNGTLYCGTDATLGGGAVTGLGNYGYIPMWNGTSSINNSGIYQSGTFIGIGTTNPNQALTVVGNVNITGNLTVGAGNASFDIYNNGSTILFDTKGNNSFFVDNVSASWVAGRNGLCIGSDCRTVWPTSSETNWNANYSNFLASYNYATNGTYLTQANWNTNYTTNNAAWLNTTNLTYDIGTKYATNGSYIGSTNATYGYALNSTPWTLNYTNFSNIYGNVTLYNGSEYKWNANYSNFSTVYGYALNGSGGISWATAYNGTLAKTDAANTFGAFNQSFNTNTLFVDANDNRVGIGTTTPGYPLDVVGSVNATSYYLGGVQSLYTLSGNTIVRAPSTKNLSLYSNNTEVVRIVLNNVGINTTVPNATLDVFGNASISGALYAGGQNITALNSTGLIQNWNATGYIANWNASGYLVNWSNLNAQEPNWNANYSNFSNIYGNVTLYNASWSNTTNLTYHTGYLYATNSTYAPITEPIWTANYTAYNATWSNTTNLTYNAYNATGLIQNWNSTGYIANWNASGYIVNWSNLNAQEPNWNANYTNFSNIYGNVTLYNGSEYRWNANYSNFSNVYGNVTLYNGSEYKWNANYSNFSNIYAMEYNGTLAQNNSASFYATTLFSSNNNLTTIAAYALNATANGISWATAYNGTLAKTDAANTFGAFNQTFDGSTFFINANDNRVGINTTTPQNTLNVVGDANITGNLTVGSGDTTFEVYNNGSTILFDTKGNNSFFVDNISASWVAGRNGLCIGSDCRTVWPTSSETNWNSNYSNFSNIYAYEQNGTFYLATNPNGYITWTNATNGTLAQNNSASFYATTVFSNSNNLTLGYLYATNGSYIGSTNATYGYALNSSLWSLNYSNFSNIYGNVTLYNGSEYKWNANYSNFSVVYGYATNASATGISWATANNGSLVANETKWNANYSNFSVVYGYATNASATGISWATAYNGTLAKTDAANTFGAFNQSFGGNLSLTSGNNSYITGNGKLIFATANDTYGGVKLTLANMAGLNGAMFEQAGTQDLVDFAFKTLTSQRNIRLENRSVYNFTGTIPEFQIGIGGDPTLVIGDNVSSFRKGRLGVNTTNATPQNTLNVIGDINATTTIFSQNKNLSLGYDYALNASASGISWATANNGSLVANETKWNANYTNFSNVYAYEQNGTFYLATNPNGYITWTNATNGTLASNNSASFYATTLFSANNNLTLGYLYATNGSYIGSGNVTYPYSLNGSGWVANYSNFLLSYNRATNGTLINSSVLTNCSAGQVVMNITANGAQCITPTATETLWNANYTNFSNIYGNVTLYNGSEYKWNANYSNFSVIYGYATNNSGGEPNWNANYTNYFKFNDTNTSTLIGANTGGDTMFGVTALGYNAAQSNKGISVTAVGTNSGYLSTGSASTSLGAYSGQQNTGDYLTALGYSSAYQNTGTAVTAVGYNSAWENNGSYATFLGASSGFQNVGNYSSGFGYLALSNNTGNNVLALGYQAGLYNNDSDQFIVKQATVNAIPLIQGNFSSGRVGIGTTAPNRTLDVFGNVKVSQNILLGDNYSIGWETTPPNGATVNIGGSSSEGYLQFVTQGNLQAIINGSNFGIGTATPQNKLNVIGDINGTTVYSGNYNLTTAAGYAFNSSGGEPNWNANYTNYFKFNDTNGTTIIGKNAGYTSMYAATVLGNGAGTSGSGTSRWLTAVGSGAGENVVGDQLAALGVNAGNSNSGNYVVAVGYAAATGNQGNDTVALGAAPANSNIGSEVNFLGNAAGSFNKGNNVNALGYLSGYNNNGSNVTAMGFYSAYQNIGNNSIGIGPQTLQGNTGENVIALGYQAGLNNVNSNQFILKQANVNANPLIQGNFSSGSVGINGTARSDRALTVSGDSGLIVNSSTGYFVNLNYLNGANVASLYALDSGSIWAPLVINPVAGNVGIGTLAPNSTLQVGGDVNLSGNLYAGGQNITALNSSGLIQNWNASGYIQNWSAVTAGGEPNWNANYSTYLTKPTWAQVTNGTLAKTNAANTFGNFNQTFNGSTLFIDANDSRVGIGTTVPNQTLDVLGNIYASGNFRFNDTNQSISVGNNSSSTLQGVTALGYQAGFNNSKNYVTAIGTQAGYNNSDVGIYLTALGYQAGYANIKVSVTALGYQAGYGNLGYGATAVGWQAGYNGNVYVPNYLAALGYQAATNATGQDLVAIGGNAALSSSGNEIVAVGYGSGTSNTGTNSEFVGSSAGYHNGGSYVNALGSNAANVNNGSYVNAIGDSAAYKNNGSYLTALGSYAGYQNTGNFSTGIGYQALYSNTGNNTIAIGTQAGMNNAADNQFIIQQANVNAVPLIQGNFSSGYVGINTTAPNKTLDVFGNIQTSGTASTNLLFNTGNSSSYIQGLYSGLGTDILFYTGNGYGLTLKTSQNGGSGYVGVNTTAPNASLQVFGNASFSGNVTSATDFCIQGGNCLSASGVGSEPNWNANYSNFSNVYAYATNGTYNTNATSPFTANYSNFSVIYGYALNSTNTFTANYTNFSNIYGYALNSTPWTLNYTNFSNIYGNVTLYNGSEYKWNANYTNFSVVYGYALNSTNTFNANYSNFSNIYAYEQNGTFMLAGSNIFNQVLNTTSGVNFSTINTTGFINGSTVYTQGNLNLTTGYNYAVNGSTFTLNYTNFSVIYGYALNSTNTFTANYSNFSNIYGYALNSTPWTLNYTNFSNIYGNVTLYNGSEYKWNANYSNFSVVYGYATNNSGVSWATINNGTMATWANVMNGTVTSNYRTLTNNTFASNVNISTNNLTVTNGTTGGRLCLSQDCASYIWNNGTGIVIQG